MLQSDKVQSSQEGKLKLKQVYSKEAKLTQEQLAQQASVSVDTVKRLLGTKECSNGVERWAVISIAKVLNIKPTEIVDPKDWYPQQPLPAEFEALIKEKTKTFCGRKFVAYDSMCDGLYQVRFYDRREIQIRMSLYDLGDFSLVWYKFR